jgi:hypothetical protein
VADIIILLSRHYGALRCASRFCILYKVNYISFGADS